MDKTEKPVPSQPAEMEVLVHLLTVVQKHSEVPFGNLRSFHGSEYEDRAYSILYYFAEMEYLRKRGREGRPFIPARFSEKADCSWQVSTHIKLKSNIESTLLKLCEFAQLYPRGGWRFYNGMSMGLAMARLNIEVFFAEFFSQYTYSPSWFSASKTLSFPIIRGVRHFLENVGEPEAALAYELNEAINSFVSFFFDQLNLLMAAHGKQLPFEPDVRTRMRWSAPVALLNLTLDRLIDYGWEKELVPVSVRFIKNLAAESGFKSKLDRLVVLDSEIEYLKSLTSPQTTVLFEYPNSDIDSNALLGMLTPYRVKMGTLALNLLRKEKGTANLEPRESKEPNQFTTKRQEVIAGLTAFSTLGRDIEPLSLQVVYFQQALGAFQLILDMKLAKHSRSQQSPS